MLPRPASARNQSEDFVSSRWINVPACAALLGSRDTQRTRDVTLSPLRQWERHPCGVRRPRPGCRLLHAQERLAHLRGAGEGLRTDLGHVPRAASSLRLLGLPRAPDLQPASTSLTRVSP